MSNYTREAQLAAQLEEVRAERDWAHCEMNEWRERHDALFDEALRLKAQWQAEALEQHADYLLDHGQGVARLWAQEHANELRRQAEADQ